MLSVGMILKLWDQVNKKKIGKNVWGFDDFIKYNAIIFCQIQSVFFLTFSEFTSLFIEINYF